MCCPAAQIASAALPAHPQNATLFNMKTELQNRLRHPVQAFLPGDRASLFNAPVQDNLAPTQLIANQNKACTCGGLWGCSAQCTIYSKCKARHRTCGGSWRPRCRPAKYSRLTDRSAAAACTARCAPRGPDACMVAPISASSSCSAAARRAGSCALQHGAQLVCAYQVITTRSCGAIARTALHLLF